MTILDEPATRLLKLFKSLEARGAHDGHTQALSNFFSEYLGVDEVSGELLYHAFDVMALPGMISNDLQRTANFDPDVSLMWLPGASAAVSVFGDVFSSTIGSVTAHLNPETMLGLTFAASSLRVGQEEFAENEWIELTQQLHTLEHSVVTSSELPEKLRIYLLALVVEMRIAVQSVRVSGIGGLLRARRICVGEYVILSTRNDLPSSFKEKFAAVTNNVIKAVAGANASYAALENFEHVRKSIDAMIGNN